MEPLYGAPAAGQLVVASDIRNSLFRRALVLLDEVHLGLEEFSFGSVQPDNATTTTEFNTTLAVVPAGQGVDVDLSQAGALVVRPGSDPFEQVLSTFVQGRTNTARRAVDAVAQIHSEIDSILSSFEREFPPVPAVGSSRERIHEISFRGVRGQPSEEVLRMAAATTAAAARFRVRAAEAAKAALQVYDSASKQAAAAAQATTKALELQVMAEQYSMAGNLPQALDAIRQANRFRDESAEAALNSRKLQEEYMRHRKEAQEAHTQADAAMRHAYSLERGALRSSTEAAAQEHALWRDRYSQLARQAEDLQAQAASCDAEADAAGARAEQAQQHADMHMAAGNYELGNALMGEAVRSKEQAGYARAQAAAAREALQRLLPDVKLARERMEEAEQHVQELTQREAQLQDATAKQRKDRLEEEVAELGALCTAAESAAAMHEELVRVYEERLAEDQQQYHVYASEGKTAEADALAVHISTWQELLQVARQNRDSSKTEAEAMRARLLELSKVDVSEASASAPEEEPPEEYRQLRDAKDREERATQAAALLVRELKPVSIPVSALEAAGTANDGLLLQTELHHQRIAKLTEQMHRERQRVEEGSTGVLAEGLPDQTQAESLLDSMAVSHLVGTLETTRLLQLWKQRSEQAAASAQEMRENWAALEQEATTKADEAVRLEEQALAFEQAGSTEEAASTMAQAEELHRVAEQLRVQADKAKAALLVREKAAGDAQTQSRFLVQGLHDVEHAAERLQAELGLRGYILEAQQGQEASVSVPVIASAPNTEQPSGPVAPTLPQMDGTGMTQDELATVMMASPSLLSRSSSIAAANVLIDTTGATRLLNAASTGDAGGELARALAMQSSSVVLAATTSGQEPAADSERFRNMAEYPWLSSTAEGLPPIGDTDGMQRHDARLDQLIRELESHISADVRVMPEYRWDGYSAFALALQSSVVDEAALAAALSSSAAMLEQARDCAGIAELQMQHDEARQARWNELVAELGSDADGSVLVMVEKASGRCSATAAASSLAGDALARLADCHDSLTVGVGSYRRALVEQRTAQQAAVSAQTEAAALQQQAYDAHQVEADLSQRIQHLEGQIAVFEAEGRTAQALTARYELRRLQNKHEEAAAQAGQLYAAYETAQARATEAVKKEVEATVNVDSAKAVLITVVHAASEAGAAVQHALDGYSHAVSALVLGAQVDLVRIRTGDPSSAAVSEEDVQRRLDGLAEQTAHANRCLAATRRLQEAVSAELYMERGSAATAMQAGSDSRRQSGVLLSEGQLVGRARSLASEGAASNALLGSRPASIRSLRSELSSSAPTQLGGAQPSLPSGLQETTSPAASHGTFTLSQPQSGGALSGAAPSPPLSAASSGLPVPHSLLSVRQGGLPPAMSGDQSARTGSVGVHVSVSESSVSGAVSVAAPDGFPGAHTHRDSQPGTRPGIQLPWSVSDKTQHGASASGSDSGDLPAWQASDLIRLGAVVPSSSRAQPAWSLADKGQDAAAAAADHDAATVLALPLSRSQAAGAYSLASGERPLPSGRSSAASVLPPRASDPHTTAVGATQVTSDDDVEAFTSLGHRSINNAMAGESGGLYWPSSGYPSADASQGVRRSAVQPSGLPPLLGSDSVRLGAFSSAQSGGLPGILSTQHGGLPSAPSSATPGSQSAHHAGLYSAPSDGESAFPGVSLTQAGPLTSASPSSLPGVPSTAHAAFSSTPSSGFPGASIERHGAVTSVGPLPVGSSGALSTSPSSATTGRSLTRHVASSSLQSGGLPDVWSAQHGTLPSAAPSGFPSAPSGAFSSSLSGGLLDIPAAQHGALPTALFGAAAGALSLQQWPLPSPPSSGFPAGTGSIGIPRAPHGATPSAPSGAATGALPLQQGALPSAPSSGFPGGTSALHGLLSSARSIAAADGPTMQHGSLSSGPSNDFPSGTPVQHGLLPSARSSLAAGASSSARGVLPAAASSGPGPYLPGAPSVPSGGLSVPSPSSSSAQQPVFALPFSSAKAAHQALGTTPLPGSSSIICGQAEERGLTGTTVSLHTGEASRAAVRSSVLSADPGFPPATSSALPLSLSGRQSPAVSILKGFGGAAPGGFPGALIPSAPHPVLSALPSDSAHAMLAIEAELDGLYNRYQQQLELKRSPLQSSPGDANKEDRLEAHRVLEEQLREAQEQLRTVQAQESLMRDATPAEVQASHDRLQYHEQRVAMLQQALQACDELAASRSAVDRTREAMDIAELEAKRRQDTLALLDRASELCSLATRELQLQTQDVRDQVDPTLQQRLAIVQETAASIEQRRMEVRTEAEQAQGRCQQLAEQLAAEESAVQLREDWLQQARKAAEAASTTMSWDERVNAARVELHGLEAPFQELKDKAAAASDMAQNMASAAASHRQQAGGLARKAAEQREDARRLAANGRVLEAEAAKVMADSLQQEADGLLTQAAKMDEDAGKLDAEARELDQAAKHARVRAAVQAEVLEQVSEAHRLSVSALQWNRTAAMKLHDASQKQTSAAQQQFALAEAEKNLASMEAQVSGHGGGSSLRPDALASQMINVVRAKQQSAQMRAALRAAQHQLDQDRDAAAAAVRQAGKAEGQCAQLAPKIQELEQQALSHAVEPAVDGRASDTRSRTSGPGEGAVRANDLPGSRSAEIDVAPVDSAATLPGPNAQASGIDSQGRRVGSAASVSSHTGTLPFGLSIVLSTSDSEPRPMPSKDHVTAACGTDLQAIAVGKGLLLPTGTAAGGSGTLAPGGNVTTIATPALAIAPISGKGHQQGPDARSDSGLRSPPGGSRTASVTTVAGSEPTSRSNIPATVGADESAPINVVAAPVSRVRLPLRVELPQLGKSSASATGDASVGGSVRRTPRGSPLMPSSRAPSVPVSPHRGFREDRVGSQPPSPSVLRISLIPAQREPSHLSDSTYAPGALARSERVDGQGGGTAGDLFDKVAGRSLRPLSNIKIARSYGSPALSVQIAGTSRASDLSSRRDTDASGFEAGDERSQQGRQRDDRWSERKADSLPDVYEEADQQEGRDAGEPDTKMYKGIKQRLAELEGRIQALRRQGDTASTAADMLCRKQDQLRADIAVSRDVDGERQATLLDHGDAMIQLKEVEASLFHKQADLLEEEAAVCRDALQYAVSDWHLRRELQRLESRCALLSSKAENTAAQAQAADADVADAMECVMLAHARDGRQRKGYAATLEQQSLSQFVCEQEERLRVAKQRAADCRAEAAQLATTERAARTKRLLAEKKALCNKALYQSAVELADAYEQAAKIAAQEQHYRLRGMQANANVIEQELLQLGGTSANDVPLSPQKERDSTPVPSRPHWYSPEVLKEVARMGDEVADALRQQLEEIVGPSSEAAVVLRRRVDRILLLVQLYQASYDNGDHLLDVQATSSETAAHEQPPSETAKRAAQISTLQEAVRDLDRACGFALDLRAMCVEASGLQAAVFDARTEPGTIHAQLSGQEVATVLLADREELDKLIRRLASLDVEIPLARDQLSGALQVVDYRQAAAQLADAQKDLEYASGVASKAAADLESRLSVRREGLAMVRDHLNAVLEEARVFTAGGNMLQAAAAEEAAQRLAKDALAVEASLTALVQEAQLKCDEQLLAGAGAEELRHVAEGSTELAGILLRIVELQQEARVVSRLLSEIEDDTVRHGQEAKSLRELSEAANKQAEALQHESLQCRTNLKFVDADALLLEARRCRARAQEHMSAASKAEKAAASASQQQQALARRQGQLLKEIGLLHAAAGHLQDALSCMRDKHHLVRKMRDVEYQTRSGGPSTEDCNASTTGRIAEKDVLQTQVAASDSTIEHHLASKASYILAADNLHLSLDSLRRADECALQAESAMQDVMKARLSVAASGKGAVPLLTSGFGAEIGLGTFQGPETRLALIPRLPGAPSMQDTDGSEPASAVLSEAATHQPAGCQVHQAELRYRCLRASLSVLESVAEAAQRASDARAQQVSLSDQAAGMVSDLAAKILEAEASADEASGLELSAQSATAGTDEEDEANLKIKLMVNALLQKAEAYRGEAAAMQGRIQQLQDQEHAANARATDLETALAQIQADHRHTLEALDLTERVGQYREQQASLQSQARALTAEVSQLEREVRGMESKTAQLRQQLTTASHSARSEDVANLMLVMQQMIVKAAAHQRLQQQRKAELQENKAEGERLAVEIRVMTERAEHVLRASETHQQVRQASSRITQLESDLSAAQASCDDCACMLDELRQHSLQLTLLSSEDGFAMEAKADALSTSTISSARQSQQFATAQAAISLGEQMLGTHTQRVNVLQTALAAWKDAKQRLEAVLRHQEQLVQQAEWRVRLSQYKDALGAAAAGYAEKAQQLRADIGMQMDSSRLVLTTQTSAGRSAVQSGQGLDALKSVRSQAAAIKAASEAAHQHALAEAEDALASRAAALAAEAGQQLDRLEAASDLTQAVQERLSLAANASMSVARLQLACVDVCADQGSELATMHDALSAVRGFAGRIQLLLEAADHHVRAGLSMEAAAARGQATAVQEALQQDLKVVRLCRQHLSELDGRMQEAMQELELAEKRLAQVTRPAAVAQSISEYVHRACELHFQCGTRQRNALRLLRLAAGAKDKGEASRRDLKASREAAGHLTQVGKVQSAEVVSQASAALERSIAEAEAERRLLEAQLVQAADTCTSEASAAALFSQLASISVNLLRHMDELDAHQEEHGRLAEELETLQRSQQGAQALLLQRRGELDALGGQIEAHKFEAQLLCKMGNDAQARVRQDAANHLTGQLAEIAEDVMKLEARGSALEQRHAVLSSMHAKSEARAGLLSQLVKLCSAAVGHLLDARDAHDSHTTCMRDAAVAAVELAKAESVLAAAETRVSELRDSLSRLQRDYLANLGKGGLELAPGPDSHQDPGDLLRAANLAQAELLLAQRQRVSAEQDVTGARTRSAQADLAVQSSQLRITKARQRTEDAQGLVSNILAVLGGSDALVLATSWPSATATTSISAAPGAISIACGSFSDVASMDSVKASHNHGVLAAAQLQSVTLQALAEAASKFVQALDTLSAAEDARSDALASAQKAQATREAASRQEALVAELQAAADGATLAQQVHRFQGRRADMGAGATSRRSVISSVDLRGDEADGAKWVLPIQSPDAAHDATAVATVELERLQHEAAYREATAAQEQKTVACLEHQHDLLRLASGSLMDMARFGVNAELKASPSMTADEAASLLAACKRLSQQHAATLLLNPALDSCKQAEACLRASLECVQEASRMRDEALARSLAVLSAPSPQAPAAGSASVLGSGTPRGTQTLSTSSRDTRPYGASDASGLLGTSVRKSVVQGDTSEAREALQAERKQLLADEERMLQQVQELDATAMQLLEESRTHSAAFEAQWAVVRCAGEVRQQLESGSKEDASPAGSAAPLSGCDARSPAATPSWSQLSAPGGQQRAFDRSLSQLLTDAAFFSVTATEGSSIVGKGLWGLQQESPETEELPHNSHAIITISTEGLRASAPGVASPQQLPDDAACGQNGMATAAQKQEDSPSPADMQPTARSDDASFSPVRSHHRQQPRAMMDAGDIDAELVAMAAATVARAKAAAAALAMRSFPTVVDRQPAPRIGVDSCMRERGEEDSAPVSSRTVSAEPRSGHEQHLPMPMGTHRSGQAPGSPIRADGGAAGKSHWGTGSPGGAGAVWEAGRAAATAQTLLLRATSPHMQHTLAARSGPDGDPNQAWESPTADAAAMPPYRTMGSPWAVAGSDGPVRDWLASHTETLSNISSSSTLAPPSSSATELDLPVMTRQAPTRSHQAPSNPSTVRDHGEALHAKPDSAAAYGRFTIQPTTPRDLAPLSTQQPPTTKLSARGAESPTGPVLARLPLPEDLEPAAAAAFTDLWSAAAIHYERLQHMHDSSLQYVERQWQRCQAQLQMLQAEELRARSDGRLGEADAVATAAAKWQQRAGYLTTALQRHSTELVRYKAMVHRAMAMGERLQLAASVSAGAPTAAKVRGAVAEASELISHLVPRLPATLLAGCGVMQSLDRLHGELVQQMAALHAAVAGLQQQSQRLFAKASRRSSKLKAQLGVTEGAASISKSQLCADQSAALGERAVELAAHARTLQEVAERLSSESTHCSHLLERLQRASEQELVAQQALVQAVDLLLCEAMQATALGDQGWEAAGAGCSKMQGPDLVASVELRMQSVGLTGDFDSLLRAGHPPGACASAALVHARRGEDLAQEAARAVQSAKEQLEQRLGSFARSMGEAATALSSMASQRARQHESLQQQVEAAALCVARARSKAIAQRATGDAAAADKYTRAGEGWAKYLEKLRREAMVASAAAEDLIGRAQALNGLGIRLRPMQAALDNYLDQHLEAWASAALSRVQASGVAGHA